MKKQSRYGAFFWEESPFFRVLIPLIVAIIFYDGGRRLFEGTWHLYLVCLICLVFFASGSVIKSLHPAIPWLRFCLLQCLVFVTGLLACHLHDARTQPGWFGHQPDSSAVYIARLDRMPVEKAKTWKLTVRITGMLREGHVQPVSGKAFVYVYKKDPASDSRADSKIVVGDESCAISDLPKVTEMRTGDELMLPGNWQRIQNQQNPFEFDYRKFASRNGFYYQQFLQPSDVLRSRKGGFSEEGLISYVHNWCMRQLAFYITDSATLGILQAMLVGDDAHLDPDLRLAYSETGIIHVVAISGSHVMMFFMIISALLFWLKHKKRLWIKYMIALPLVWFYVLVSGAPPSAVRAAIMFSVLAFGISLQKNSHSLNQLFATAFLLLCFEPMWLFSVGFQLSFIAVLSLILFFKPICNLWPQTNKISKALWETICASLAAELLVAPLVIYYFHLFPLTFLPANIIAWMLMGFVLVLGLLLIAVSWIPVLAQLLAWVLTLLVSWFNMVIYALQEINPEPLRHLLLSAPALVVLYIMIVCFAVFLMRKYKPALWIGLSASILLLTLLCAAEWQTLKQHRIVVLNIQGKTRLERIAGKRFYALTPGNDDAGAYTLQAIHTGWQAWREGAAGKATDLYQVNGKWLIHVYKRTQFNSVLPFPVDVLLVDLPLQEVSFSELTASMLPGTIVVGGNQRGREAEAWAGQCRQSDITFHFLKRDGAFVME